ncbi:hypothetical protein G6F56_003592 [Rhizopus delemar]|nr:hypothetical protein G6F56_003592 [Rhizopus delemar]
MVEISINFHGVQIAGNIANGKNALFLEPQLMRVDTSASLCSEDALDVKFSFSNLRKCLRPTKSNVKHMHPNCDTLPNSLVAYQLVLQYNFTIDAAATIVAPGVFGIMYDANGKAFGYLDVFNQKIKFSQKSDYIIILQLSNENESVLEKLNSYQNMSDVYSKSSTLTIFFFFKHKDIKILYIAVPDGKHASAKEFKTGDALVGKLESTGSDEGDQYKVINTSASNLAPLLIKVKSKRKAGHPSNALKATGKFLTEFSFAANNTKDISKVWKEYNGIYKSLG